MYHTGFKPDVPMGKGQYQIMYHTGVPITVKDKEQWVPITAQICTTLAYQRQYKEQWVKTVPDMYHTGVPIRLQTCVPRTIIPDMYHTGVPVTKNNGFTKTVQRTMGLPRQYKDHTGFKGQYK